MSKMNEVSMDLEILQENLYRLGLGHPEVKSEVARLSELGFIDEVKCIIHDFETAVFNGDLEDF
jgi:hypothetical protein